MSCEDYDPEDSMGIGEERREVLDIVRRILRNRTDWIAQGQTLMEEIVAEVVRHGCLLPGPTRGVRPAPS